MPSHSYKIDTHAHVFERGCAFAPGRRYTPAGEAPLSHYLPLLVEHGLTHGVLVQPSFLGADNSYLLDCLRQEPEKLRGIVVVDPSVDRKTLEEFDMTGVVGIRLNYKKEQPNLETKKWRRLLGWVGELGWQIEVSTSAELLPGMLAALCGSGANLVVDHFGRPDTRKGLACPVFRVLIEEAIRSGRIWVKMSAPYRSPGGNVRMFAESLLENLGPERLLWGSDWPWTQNEEGKTYHRCLEWLNEWVPDAAQRDKVLGETPFRLFRFREGN